MQTTQYISTNPKKIDCLLSSLGITFGGIVDRQGEWYQREVLSEVTWLYGVVTARLNSLNITFGALSPPKTLKTKMKCPNGGNDMLKLTVPAVVVKIDSRDEERLKDLFRRFGNARRRAYMLKQRGVSEAEIKHILQQQIEINHRYAKDAHYSIRNLPSNVTFGGLNLQRMRERGEITREEYKKRRNSLIISRGDRTKRGNLNARIIRDGGKLMLRINVPPEGRFERWIYPEIFIPEKYLKCYGQLVNGSRPYTVVLKRRNNDRGYDVRIIVEVPENPALIPKRMMALDINAGHIDFAVAERKRVLVVGKINCHEVQHASTNKTNNLLHLTAKKIKNIAQHYGSGIVYGKLNTQKFKANRGANRRVKRIPHHKLGLILGYKCGAKKRSEAYTSRLGEKISPLVGLDVHKCAAAVFALKTLDYEKFKTLRSSSDETFPRGTTPNEGAGSLKRWPSTGSGLTALHQGNLMHDEVAPCRNGGYSSIPSRGGLSFVESLKTDLPCFEVRVC